jgi:hypothetical protein
LLDEAIVAGASETFPGPLMTATVATLGMLPAALATGVGSDVRRGVALSSSAPHAGDAADAVRRSDVLFFARAN